MNSMDFSHIKTAVASQFQHLQSDPTATLYRVDVDRDLLWSTYLSSFPPGTDPLYRQRTGHDCSCCRQFIRTVGDVVAVIDGVIVSIWDVEIPQEPAYQAVVDALSALVHSCPITAPFYHYEGAAGTDKNFEILNGETGINALGEVRTWTHFHVNIDRRYVRPKSEIPTLISNAQSSRDVFLRSLTEITHDAIDTVLDLVAQNSLYRGEEHAALIRQFQLAKSTYDHIPDTDPRRKEAFGFVETGAVARIRNTSIGTLLTDLSTGMDLDAAVRSYESKVAPTNYKRPTALVTPAMVKKAKETLQELGLLSALDRRYATLRDLNVNDILFADRTARKALTGDVFDELASSPPVTVKNLDRVEEVPISRFLTDILPRIDTLELLFENRHQSNLVSLIAPCDPTSRPLFKWNNLFSWSYSGELADAIKERVKQAGGNVTGDLCCRLAWWNHDDLDLHMVEPNQQHIYFGNRHGYRSGGQLDVDMNVVPTTRQPVENIFYARRSGMPEGEYHLYVDQYNKRESQDAGFACEIDYLGQTYRFTYSKALRTGENVTVARFRYSHKNGLEIIESLPSTQSSRVVWGLPTQVFHRVDVLTMSPNCWGQQRGDTDYTTGNRHYFFMLDSCQNDGTARGFFNEFLREDLNVHRKTMEVVASKMKPEPSDDQLSGLGFSSTRRDTVICRVKGKGNFQRTIKISF